MSYPIRPDTPQQSPGPNPRERSKRPLVDDTCNLDSKRRCTKDQPPVSTTPTVALPIAHQYLHHLLTVCVFFALALYATPGWNKTSKTSNIPYFDDAVVLGTRSQTPENELPPAEPSTQASARGSIKSGRSRSYSGSTPEASTPESLTPKGSPPKWLFSSEISAQNIFASLSMIVYFPESHNRRNGHPPCRTSMRYPSRTRTAPATLSTARPLLSTPYRSCDTIF